MPPYENQSMHDMHALLQQFDTLNAAHAPEHLEWPSMPSMPDLGITKTMKDTYAKRVEGKDPIKEEQWKAYATTEAKMTVFDNTLMDLIADMRQKGENAWTSADFDALKNNIQSNKKAKVLFEANIIADPKLKTRQATTTK